MAKNETVAAYFTGWHLYFDRLYTIMVSVLQPFKLEANLDFKTEPNIESESESESGTDKPEPGTAPSLPLSTRFTSSDSFIEPPWVLIESYFNDNYQKKLVRHQLESFNYFTNIQLEQTIRMFNPLRIKSDKEQSLSMELWFDNLRLARPQIHETNGSVKTMFPQEARLRNFTYASTMTVNINIKYVVKYNGKSQLQPQTQTQLDGGGEDGKQTTTEQTTTEIVHHKILPNIHIGKLPIMVKSDICMLTAHSHLDETQTGECKYDPGGYFIVNGSEKIVIGQIRPAENCVFCYRSTLDSYVWVAEIRSVPDHKCISPKQTNMMISARGDKYKYAISVDCPRIKKKPVSLFVLFRALGIVSDREICDFILADILDPVHRVQVLKLLEPSAMEAAAAGILTQDAAITYVADCIASSSIYSNANTSTYTTPSTATTAAPKMDDADVGVSVGADDGVDAAPAPSPIASVATTATATAKPKYKTKQKGQTGQPGDPLPSPEYIRAARLKSSRLFVQVVLDMDIFPHCPTRAHKAHFLGHMASILCRTHLNIRSPDDRDSVCNQRVDTAGVSINNLMRNYFNRLVKDMERHIVSEIDSGIWRSSEDHTNIINMTNIYHIVKSSTIENGIKRALSTGDFSVKHNNVNKVGVAQVLNRLTYLSGLSHARRVASPPDKSGKLIPPRKLHGASWGFYCPSETPEGAAVGIVKNMSCMAHITIPSDSRVLYDYVMPFVNRVEDANGPLCGGIVRVLINGVLVGVIPEMDANNKNTVPAFTLYQKWKHMKHTGVINVYTSIVFDIRALEIRFCTAVGRLSRPVLRVINNQILLTHETLADVCARRLSWDDLLVRGYTDTMGRESAVLEYIDAEEQGYMYVAESIRDLINTHRHYTHCEIHACTIFGVIASCIPFPDHNQSPRVTYQAAQQKQAVGKYVTNHANRMDKTAYVLTYPMRPLVDTRIMKILKLNELPSGCTVTIAIMTHTGYNQEDSILVNQGSIDRGLLQLNIYHTEKDEDKQKINGDEEIRCKPDKTRTRGTKCGNYNKVNHKGIVPENTRIENGDIIIAKVVPIKGTKADLAETIKYEDRSKIYYTDEPTYIDKNYIDRNGDGYTFAKTRLRAMRQPCIGDKFSSRHGQKGTIGNIIPEADMPYDSNGERPDIIINPHAIPSRMTIGHLKETLLGELLLILGLFGDGTGFGDLTVQEISAMLLALGRESNCNKILVNGLTGEQMECDIFMGPVFYQRLKHMVVDKQHSRSTGTMVPLTRQPPEGRTRNGGLRFGEMEKDAMSSHGATRFTRDRIYDVSDKFDVHVCKRCGMIAAYNTVAGIHLCRTCDNRTDFRHVQLPFACKALFQELMTMNICPRIMTR